jgi:multidrug efflux system membrane fusion protein
VTKPQYVNVVVTLATESAVIVVPTVAVQAGQQGPYVFAVTGDRTVEMRPVSVARTRGGETVIARGVAPGETVVTDGHLRLVPGSRISENTSKGCGSGFPGPVPHARLAKWRSPRRPHDVDARSA